VPQAFDDSIFATWTGLDFTGSVSHARRLHHTTSAQHPRWRNVRGSFRRSIPVISRNILILVSVPVEGSGRIALKRRVNVWNATASVNMSRAQITVSWAFGAAPPNDAGLYRRDRPVASTVDGRCRSHTRWDRLVIFTLSTCSITE